MRSGWDRFAITLLRPQGWLRQHSRQGGSSAEVWIDLDELNAHGWAKVVRESPCPVIEAGPGRVVTATITHRNDDVRTLTLDGGQTLHVTGNHRMYSASAQDWVPVKHLRVGEELRTSEGRHSVASLGYQRGRHQVYNLEVEQEHCYFVGQEQMLAHNTCGPDGDAPEAQKPKGDGDGIVNKGGKFSDLDKIKGDGEVGHHMAQNAYNKTIGISRGDGPALGMTKADHALTRTYAGKGNGTMSRDGAKQLNARQRLALDKRDIRALFGKKYNQGMLQMRAHQNTLKAYQRKRK